MQWLKHAAEQYPNKVAIIYQDEAVTYEMLYEKSKMVAYHLQQLNEPRIALQAENTLIDSYIIHGAMLSNIELVMINKHLTEQEIIKQMTSVEVELLITDQPLTQMKTKTKRSLSEPVKAIIDDVDNINNDILSIMFTSGTTGTQKAVPQRYKNHLASAENCKQAFPYNHNSVWLNVLPLFHISGLSIMLRAVIDACTVVLHKQFDECLIQRDLQRYKVTHVSLVPQTLERLLKAGLNQPFFLQGILIGGAKLDHRLLTQARAFNLPIYTSFGMTETCSQMITATPNDILVARNSVGKVKGNIKIINHNQGVGEVAVKGHHVMDGYLYPEKANASAYHDGYFLTGDIGYIKDDYLYILDRRKDLIISGGENVYPSEIEQVILTHTNIEAVAVIPKNDEQWGQVPVCVYEGESDQQEAIINAVTTHLAKYKHPKQYVRTKEIIRTTNGKISRHKIKEWFDAMH